MRRFYSHPVAVGDRMREPIASYAEYERVKNAAHMYARRRGQKFATRRQGDIVTIRRIA